MGGRDHSCPDCGRGGFNDPNGECVCAVAAENATWRSLPPVSEAEQPEVPERPSVTWLKRHDVCDRAAMLALKYGGGAGSHAMNRGSIFHAVVADLTRELIREREPKIPGELAKDALYAYLDAHPELQVPAVERDALRAMIWNWCEGTYFDRPIIAVETTVSMEIEGFTVTGRIDLAEDLGGGMIGVSDYKTSFVMPNSEEFKPQSFHENGEPRFAGDFQTQLYALMLAEGTLDDGMPLGEGYDRFKLRLVFPRYLRPEGLASREVTVTRLQLLDFKIDVEHQLRRLREVNIGERRWQPTPGSHCRECPAADECPLPPVLRPESQLAGLDSLAELEEVATNWSFASDNARQLKARLRKAAERLGESDPGALDLGDGERGVRIGTDLALVFLARQTETVRDKAALREAIERAVKYGEPIDFSQHYRTSDNVEFAKRKVAPKGHNERNE